jgi:PAS domain-containing protein
MQEVKHKKESITSNEIVNLLSGSTDSIIWKLDSLNKFTYISGNIQTLLGFDELHFLTKAISTIFYDSDNRSIFLSELKSFQLSQQKHLNTSGCIKRKDGKPVYTDITLLHGTDNSEGEIIGCFKNLSIQKQLNHEFEKFNPTNFSDAIFSKALQTISTIVWVFNLENGHFNYSPHFLKLLGYLPEEVLQKNFYYNPCIRIITNPFLKLFITANFKNRVFLKQNAVLSQKMVNGSGFYARGML